MRLKSLDSHERNAKSHDMRLESLVSRQNCDDSRREQVVCVGVSVDTCTHTHTHTHTQTHTPRAQFFALQLPSLSAISAAQTRPPIECETRLRNMSKDT